jgi:hypothetical protein
VLYHKSDQRVQNMGTLVEIEKDKSRRIEVVIRSRPAECGLDGPKRVGKDS